VDAERIAALGARSLQVHTDGMCHMDAGMTRTGLEAMGTDAVDLCLSGECRQSDLPGGVRYRRRQERHDPEHSGRRRQAAEVSADV
jgi:hypothetical protein